MKRSNQFSLRIVIALVGIGPICAKSAPPQIIEVHKDPSISDSDRLEDFQTYEMNNFTPNFEKACKQDTTYWVVSKKIYPSNASAFQDVPESLKIKPFTKIAYRKAGIGITGSEVLPMEFMRYYKGHYILVSWPIDDCTKTDIKLLKKYFGTNLIEIGGDLTSCSISDTNEVVDADLQANKLRAKQLGEHAHSIFPKASDKPFAFNYSGISLILGACLDIKHAQRILQFIDTSFYVFRVTK